MQGSPTTTRIGRRRNSPWFRDPLRINGDLPYPRGCPKRWLLSPNPSPSGAGGSSRRGAEARWRFQPGCGVGKVHARYPRFFWGGILGKFIFLQTKAGAENSFDVSVFPFLPIPSLRLCASAPLRLCASAPLRESSPSGTGRRLGLTSTHASGFGCGATLRGAPSRHWQCGRAHQQQL